MARGWICVAWFLAACAGDKSPVEKCDDLTDELCNRAVDCIAMAGSHASCVQQLQQVLPCGSAKSVSASYDRCIEQLSTDSCPVLFPADPQTGQPTIKLPADCMSVILTRTEASAEDEVSAPAGDSP